MCAEKTKGMAVGGWRHSQTELGRVYVWSRVESLKHEGWDLAMKFSMLMSLLSCVFDNSRTYFCNRTSNRIEK